MIFGECYIANNAIHTHNDTYILDTVSTYSARRPFCAPCIIIASLTVGFCATFWDLLYIQEILAAAAFAAALLCIGMCLGQLTLLSRDLKGSDLSGAVFGTYPHINRLRREIAARKRSTAEDLQ